MGQRRPFRIDEHDAIAMMRRGGLEPLEPFPGADKKWRCQCVALAHEVAPSYSTVRSTFKKDPTRSSNCCSKCARMRVGAQTRTPDWRAVAIMRESGYEPLCDYPGNNRTPWPCKCLVCGETRDVRPTLTNVQQGHSRCKWCSRRVIDPDSAVQLMEQAGVTPLDPYPGRDTRWRVRCQACGNERWPTFTNVRAGHAPCAICAGRAVDPEVATDLMRTAGLEPLDSYPGYNKNPWRCLCTGCGQEVSPPYNSIQRGQGGCRTCATSGMDLSAPAKIYLLQSKAWFACKVGIMGHDSKRLTDHQRSGWSLASSSGAECLWPVDSGEKAFNIEQAIIEWWRTDLGAPIAVGREALPRRGHTETASLGLISIDETAMRIEGLLRRIR